MSIPYGMVICIPARMVRAVSLRNDQEGADDQRVVQAWFVLKKP